MNNHKPEKTESKGMLAMIGLPMLSAACCGLPLLLTAVGFTAAGAFLTGKEYWLFGGFMLIIGMVMLIRFLIGKRSNPQKSCAVPPKNEHRASVSSDLP